MAKYAIFYTAEHNVAEIISWEEIKGRIIYSKIKNDPQHYDDIIPFGERGAWADICKAYVKDFPFLIKRTKLNEIGYAVIKSYLNLKDYKFCMLAQGKSKQYLAKLKTLMENNNEIKWAVNENDESLMFSRFLDYKLMFIPKNNAYVLCNMEDSAKQMGMGI